MKKIIIVDGGPRKTFNMAAMLKSFAEGAGSVNDNGFGTMEYPLAAALGERFAECLR